MNTIFQKSGIIFLVAFFMPFLAYPSVSFSASNQYGKVTTFVPSFSRQGEDLGSVSFKGIFNLSDDTTIGNAWFEWGDTSSLGKRTSSILIGKSEAFLAEYLSGLDINDFYYYRAVAQESDGEYVYGDTIRFRIIDGYAESLGSYVSDVGTIVNTTTSYPAPVAITLIPQVVNDTTVIIKGEAKTNTSINTYGSFRWGTTIEIPNQTISRNLGTGYFGLTFSETLSGLSKGQIYYYRAEVVGPGGRSVGSVLAFTTDGGLVTGFNQPVSVVTPTTQVTPTTPVTTPASSNKTSYKPKIIAPSKNSETTTTNTDIVATSSTVTKDTTQKSSTGRGFWATLFGIGDDETSKNGANEQINEQKALVVSGGGFFPKSIFGWIILTILIILLVAIFVYVQILHEQVKTLREERERGRNGNGNGNGLGVTHNNH